MCITDAHVIGTSNFGKDPAGIIGSNFLRQNILQKLI